jgi:hypothetical protein
MTVEQPTTSLARRLVWFVVLWLAGVGSVAIVAFILRLWLK